MKLRSTGLAMALLLAALALQGCEKPEVKEAKYVNRGNQLFDKGDYDKALVEYKNALRIMPADAEVIYRMALINENNGDIRGAMAGYLRAEQQNPHHHPALLKIARYFIAANMYDEAEKRIETVLSDTPDDAEAHALEGGLDFRKKDFGAAEKEVRTALAKDPANITAISVLTGIYAAQNDAPNALATVEDGITRNPTNLQLLLLRSQIYEKTGDLPKVDETYQRIFKLAPKEPKFHTSLAAIYAKEGRNDEAEAAMRAGIAAFPDDWDQKRLLTSFIAEKRGTDAAEKEIRGYMEAHPEKDDLFVWLVELYMKNNEGDKAVALLKDVITQHQFDKQGLIARTTLARIDYVKGDKDGAAKLTAEVLEKQSDNLDALFMRAHLEADNGDYDNAVTDLRTITRIQPKATEALRLLSEVFLSQGHLDLAVDTESRLIEADPQNKDAHVRLAQMENMNGDPKHALEILSAITKDNPTYAPAWETTARVALGIKDWNIANGAIEALDRIDGQHDLATFLKAQVLTNTDKPSDAISLYKEIIAADPASPLAELSFSALSGIYKQQDRMEEMTRYLEALPAKSAYANTVLGECYLVLNKPDQAASALDAAIATNPARQDAYLDRATILFRAHKSDEAIALLKRGEAAAPKDMRASLMEAEILGASGKHDEAIALYDGMLTKNPNMDVIANNLAATIADYAYTDPTALEKASKATERFSGSSNPVFLDTLAWVYYREGKIAEAETAMDHAAASGAKMPPQFQYHYGAILLKANKTQEAKDRLQQAVVEGANYPGLNDAKKLLTGL